MRLKRRIAFWLIFIASVALACWMACSCSERISRWESERAAWDVEITQDIPSPPRASRED